MNSEGKSNIDMTKSEVQLRLMLEMSEISSMLQEEDTEDNMDEMRNQIEEQFKVTTIQQSQITDMNTIILSMQSQMEEQSKLILNQQSQMDEMKTIMTNMIREHQSMQSEKERMSSQLEEQNKIIASKEYWIQRAGNDIENLTSRMNDIVSIIHAERENTRIKLEEQSKLICSLQDRDEKKKAEQEIQEPEVDMILNSKL
jgi:hypothetical protein